MILRTCLIALVAAAPFTADAGLVDGFQQIFKSEQMSGTHLIKVLLIHDEPGVMIETKGKYRIFDPHNDKHVTTRTLGKRKFIQPTSEGLRWGEEFPGLHQLKIVPESPQGTILVNGIEYKGSIFVYHIHDKIFVVNELDIEDYITSVLTQQCKEPVSHEALAAMVITARTNALYYANNPKTKFWSVEAEHAGYIGYPAATYERKVEEAVKATRNMVMSRTAAYEGVVTPFPAHLAQAAGQKVKDHSVLSKITLKDVETFAEGGEHAAQILAKAFPESSIQLVN